MSRQFHSAQEWRDVSRIQCQAFLEVFPREKLSELTLENYIIGTGEQTFCWWLEIGTGQYAAINGVYSDKYGVFQGGKPATLKVAHHLKGFTPEKVFERVKPFIIDVAAKAAAGDLNGLVELATKPAKERCISPMILWKIAELYQPIDSPFLVPVCGSEAAEILGEKSAGAMQRRFQTYLPEKEYWDRCWEFTKPLRAAKGTADVVSDEDDEKGEGNPAEYERLLRILRNRKNLILQGAPGTGKTYLVPELVTRLCGEISGNADRKDVLAAYKRLTETGRVLAVTFHPSMDYDDFVQGWKPDPNADQTDGIKMKLTDGVFKRFCDSAGVRGLNEIRDGAMVWKVTPDSSGPNEVRTDCLRNNRIRIGWENEEDDGGSVNRFVNEMKIGDIVFSRFDRDHADAVGIVTGEYEELKGETAELGRCRSRRVKWLYKGDPVDILSVNNGTKLARKTVVRMPNTNVSKVRDFLKTLLQRPYVFVIDEFNRGNVPKIFGELITLVEADKREGEAEGTTVHLAYDAPEAPAFSVPSNVYILGTMNTADRSIAPIDYAMRRRFAFERILPHELADENFDFNLFDAVSRLFVTNPKPPAKRSEHLSEEFDPADVWIGHSYFLTPGGESSLARWQSEIRPLLNEYLRDGVLNPSAKEEIEAIEQSLFKRDVEK